MSAVPLNILEKFRQLCQKTAQWHKANPNHIEFDCPSVIQLTLEGDLTWAKGSALYLASQSFNRWPVAKLDKDTDPATVDCDELKGSMGTSWLTGSRNHWYCRDARSLPRRT